MKFIDRIVEAIGLVEEEEIYEDEPAATSQERKSIFKAKPGVLNREREAAEAAKAEAVRSKLQAERGDKPAAKEQALKSAGSAKDSMDAAVPANTAKPAKKPFFSFSSRQRTEMTNKTIEMPIDNKPVQVVVLEPASFDDSQKVADYLRGSQPVVINFDGTDAIVAKRMTDFVSGTIYALNGSMKKIGRNILVCAPRNVNIDADAAEKDEGQADNPWKK